jgi:hypothetical protein|tara:strand:- start:3401 stop:3685 length:285 start_codon:yes stop_codon:yes gene_type:complete
MARYPEFPTIFSDDIQRGVTHAYNKFQQWGAALVNELDTRDQQQDATPATNIYSVVTVGSIKRPDKGDIAYSVSTGKFKGYVSTAATQAWQDLN